MYLVGFIIRIPIIEYLFLLGTYKGTVHDIMIQPTVLRDCLRFTVVRKK